MNTDHFDEKGYPKPKGEKARIPLKYFFMPSRWYAFITGKLLDKYLTYEYCEQVVYRAIRCSDCLDRGHCDKCMCSTPDLFMNVSPTVQCKEKKWLPYMPPEEWREYKEAMGIELQIKQ